MKAIHLIVIGVILCVNAFGFGIISSIVYWLDFSSNINSAKPFQGIYVGLWRSCTGSNVGFVCVETQNADDWLTAVQTLTTIGIVLLGIGSVLGCVFTIKDTKPMIAYAWTSIMYLACILQTAAIIEFWASVDSHTRHFAIGFHLAILSTLSALFAGVFVILSQRTQKIYSKLESD